MPLRPYQITAARSVIGAYEQGVNRQVAQGATAFGKTEVLIEVMEPLAIDKGKQTILMSHREEIVRDAAARTRRRYPGLRVGLEVEGESAAPDDDVVICMVQSLSSDKRLARYDPARVNLIEVDECHHSTSTTYLKILDHLHVNKAGLNDSPACLVGFTATVNRHDNIGLERVYDRIVYSKSMREMIDEGWLTQPDNYRFSTNVTIPKVKLDSHGDIPRKLLASLLTDDDRDKLILREYLPFSHLPTMGFAASVEDSRRKAEFFTANGVPSVSIDGTTNKSKRRDCIEAYLAYDIRCLWNFEVFTEGTDLPPATVALMCRPTLSMGLYTQMIGRILRRFPSPEIASTHIGYVKRRAIILDFVDNSVKHKLITAPTLFGMPPCFDPKGKSLTMLADQVDEIRAANHGILPQLNFTSIDDLKTTATRFDILGDHEPPPLAIKHSKLAWFEISEDVCAIWIESQRATFEIHTDLLGQCTLFMSQSGSRLKILDHQHPAAAFAHVDQLASKGDKALLSRGSGWRRLGPKSTQCFSLYAKEPALQQRFATGKDFFDFARAEYGRGNRAYSRGGISSVLDRLIKGGRKP